MQRSSRCRQRGAVSLGTRKLTERRLAVGLKCMMGRRLVEGSFGPSNRRCLTVPFVETTSA